MRSMCSPYLDIISGCKQKKNSCKVKSSERKPSRKASGWGWKCLIFRLETELSRTMKPSIAPPPKIRDWKLMVLMLSLSSNTNKNPPKSFLLYVTCFPLKNVGWMSLWIQRFYMVVLPSSISIWLMSFEYHRIKVFWNRHHSLDIFTAQSYWVRPVCSRAQFRWFSSLTATFLAWFAHPCLIVRHRLRNLTMHIDFLGSSVAFWWRYCLLMLWKQRCFHQSIGFIDIMLSLSFFDGT